MPLFGKSFGGGKGGARLFSRSSSLGKSSPRFGSRSSTFSSFRPRISAARSSPKIKSPRFSSSPLKSSSFSSSRRNSPSLSTYPGMMSPTRKYQKSIPSSSSFKSSAFSSSSGSSPAPTYTSGPTNINNFVYMPSAPPPTFSSGVTINTIHISSSHPTTRNYYPNHTYDMSPSSQRPYYHKDVTQRPYVDDKDSVNYCSLPEGYMIFNMSPHMFYICPESYHDPDIQKFQTLLSEHSAYIALLHYQFIEHMCQRDFKLDRRIIELQNELMQMNKFARGGCLNSQHQHKFRTMGVLVCVFLAGLIICIAYIIVKKLRMPNNHEKDMNKSYAKDSAAIIPNQDFTPSDSNEGGNWETISTTTHTTNQSPLRASLKIAMLSTPSTFRSITPLESPPSYSEST